MNDILGIYISTSIAQNVGSGTILHEIESSHCFYLFIHCPIAQHNYCIELSYMIFSQPVMRFEEWHVKDFNQIHSAMVE